MRSLLFFASICLSLASPVIKRETISARDLIAAFPSTSTCEGASAPDECRTAMQAAPHIAASFSTFGITDFNTQVALVALMLYESAGFKYSGNKKPGASGQGTRNMQSPRLNTKYVHDLAKLEGSGIDADKAGAVVAQGPLATLALVNSDRWSFASAAWFLQTQCDDSVKQGLAAGTQAGWSSYLTKCLRTPATNDRTQIWDRIKSLRRWSS